MTAALVFLSTWDWWDVAAIPVLGVAFWFVTAGLVVTREAHTGDLFRERWLSAARCAELADGEGEGA